MSGHVYLLLGASGGIGSALTRRLTARGDMVFALARAEARLTALAAETGARWMLGDAREPEVVRAAVERVQSELGRLDGAACLVGSIFLKPAHGTSPQELEEVLGQNLLPAFNLVRAAAPVLAKSGGGALALMSSVAARIGIPNHEAIAAAKGAVEGLARSAAATYASRNVRVNAVAPGLVRTPLSARLIAAQPALEASQALHPLGRIGEPDEVASLLAWLLSPDGAWVTGQILGIDGGLGTLAARR